MNNVAIIAGAGPAGLTAALELIRNTNIRPIVFEVDSQPGGISRTINYRGNRMDIGGHRFFSKSEWVMNWWQAILPVADNQLVDTSEIKLSYQNTSYRFTPGRVEDVSKDAVMLVRPRLSRIYYRRKFFDYPLKLSTKAIANLGFSEVARIGMSYALSSIKKRIPERSLEDFLINRFGNRLYQTFFKSYTEKVWGVSCDQISADWGAQRIKGLSVGKALSHAFCALVPRRFQLRQIGVETSLIERFLYPKFGPGQMWEEVASRIMAGGGEVQYRSKIVGVHRSATRVSGVDVLNLQTQEIRRISCQHFISTMPLTDLVRQLKPERPSVSEIASALPYRDFITVGLLVRRMRFGVAPSTPAALAIAPDNWIYIQEPDVQIGRLQIFNNWSPYLVRDPNTVWLGLEYFCKEGDRLWSRCDDDIVDFAAKELEKIGLIHLADVLDGTVVRVPKAYPAYFGEYHRIGEVRDWLDHFENLFPIGRNGMHRYNNQDHSMLAARAAVDCITNNSTDKSAIWAVNAEEDYHEQSR